MHKRLLLIWLLLLLTARLSYPRETVHALPDSLQAVLDKSGNDDARRMEALQTVIDALHQNQQYQASTVYIAELDSLSKPSENSYFRAFSEYYRGCMAIVENNPPEALYWLNVAKETTDKLPDKNDNPRLRVRILLAIGAVYLNLVMLPEAYQAFLEGIEANKEVDDPQLQFELENNLLGVYYHLNDYREVIATSKKILSNPKYLNFNRFYLYYNMAACYTDLHCPDSANLYLDTAAICAPTPYEKALVPYYRGANNMEQRRHLEALADFDTALSEIENGGYHNLESNILIQKGMAYMDLGVYDSALAVVDKGLSIAEEHGLLYIIERGLYCKRLILYDTKEFEEYADVSNYYDRIKDSLEKTKNVGGLQQIELERQFDMAKEQMRQAQLVKDMQHQRQRLWLIIVILFLAFGVVTLTLLLSRNKILLKNKKLQEEALSKELDLRNRELTAKALVQSQRQEILTDIIEKLTAVQADKRKMSDSIQSIINDFKQYRNAQTPEDFDYYFTQTHPDFYKNLSRDFPDLTPYEMHLCAYIRLNLNTKDIAEICGIEPSSVRMARHRLRKSLGITDSETDLIKFLSKY